MASSANLWAAESAPLLESMKKAATALRRAGVGVGFRGRCGSEFGEPEMKEFVRHSRRLAEGLGRALRSLDADVRVALTHYSPVADTLAGEPPEIYPSLGSWASRTRIA